MLWFVSPAWRRYDVTRLCLAQRAHLCGELAGRGIEATCVIVADDENLDIAREFGFATVERNNADLGRRFNDGYEYALREGAEYVVHIGSDDWMHADLFDRLPLARPPVPMPSAENPVVTWGDGPEIITGREITLVDLEGGRMRRVEARGRSGVIPWILPRRAFERGFRPVKETALDGIDGLLMAGLGEQPELVFCDPHAHSRVDFKTSWNLTSYEKTTGAMGVGEELDPWAELAAWYPADLVAMARETSEELLAVAA